MEHISVSHIVGFLEKKGWTTASSNPNYVFFRPPEDLGFNQEYTLPILSSNTTKQSDYSRVLEQTLSVIADIYGGKISEILFDIEQYVGTLKENSLYFKLESKEILFEKTVEVKDVWTLLKSVSDSFSHYIAYKFKADFFDVSSEKNERVYRQSLSNLLRFSKLRLVDLQYQSFSFGVATDVVMGNDKIQIDGIKDWRKELIGHYEGDVIDEQFDRLENIEKALKKFDDKERKDIFNPLFKSISNPNIAVYRTSRSFKKIKRIKRPAQSTVDRIIVSQKKEEEKKDLAMYQIVLPIDKSKSRISFKTATIENDLFAQKADKINWDINDISFGDKTIEFITPLAITIALDNENSDFNVTFEPLLIDFNVDDFNSIGKSLFSAIIEKYLTYTELPTEGEDIILNDQQRILKDFFDNNLKNEE